MCSFWCSINIKHVYVVRMICCTFASALRVFAVLVIPAVCSENKLHVLVFGGNGFLGASIVEKLLAKGHVLTLVNRGNWYWDSATRIKPHVTHLACDRQYTLQHCEDLAGIRDSYFNVVIDFSAYYRYQIEEVFEIFNSRIGLYIYISSDSVYEVCNKTHDGFTREEDAVRPVSASDRETFSAKDDYGNRKLHLEEELNTLGNELGVPVISLRLPDVIGPRDNTYRWWIYQLWIRLNTHLDRSLRVPLHIAEQPLSLVYQDDVADLICKLCSMPFTGSNVYNLALHEFPTLLELLILMRNELGMFDVKISNSADEFTYLYPSVTLGPVDISKAISDLEWNPTSLPEVVSRTVAFYEEAMTNTAFHVERRNIIDIMKKRFTLDSSHSKVVNGIRLEYGVEDAADKDEL